jgi:hypothetical protein
MAKVLEWGKQMYAYIRGTCLHMQFSSLGELAAETLRFHFEDLFQDQLYGIIQML